MVTQELRGYELVMVLSPEITEEEVAAATEQVSAFVTERGGTMSDQEKWGVRRLAYPIRRFQEGNYVLARFTLDAKDVLDLDRTLLASESVLRHLLTKVTKTKSAQRGNDT